jgi:hypothetical protein
MRHTSFEYSIKFRKLEMITRHPAFLFQSLILFWVILPCAYSQEVPVGFNAERYASLWERNPFALEKAAAPQARPSAFEKLYLTSWMIDAGKEVVCVENSETKEVQRIAAEPNQNNVRLIAMHPNVNPRLVEALISDDKEQGTVKFRYSDQPSSASTTLTVSQVPAEAEAQALSPSVNQPGTSIHTSKLYPGLARVRSEGGSNPPTPRIPGFRQKGNPPPQSDNPQN